jgi:hypothetical protein
VVLVIDNLVYSTGDLRIGLDDNSIFGHLRKAQVYLEKAQETQKNVEVRITWLVRVRRAARIEILTAPLFP